MLLFMLYCMYILFFLNLDKDEVDPLQEISEKKVLEEISPNQLALVYTIRLGTLEIPLLQFQISDGIRYPSSGRVSCA